MSKKPDGGKMEPVTRPPEPALSAPKANLLPRWGSFALGFSSILFSLPPAWLIVSVLPYHNHVDGSMLSFDSATNRLMYGIYWGLPLIGFMLGFFSRHTWLGKIGMVLAVIIVVSGFLPHYEVSE